MAGQQRRTFLNKHASFQRKKSDAQEWFKHTWGLTLLLRRGGSADLKQNACKQHDKNEDTE